MQLTRGTVVAERFRVEALAGAGGMGTVYRAIDHIGGGQVALKLMAGSGEDEAQRFVREAVLLAGLDHPAVVRYLAHGRTPAGELYLAMEWLEGEDLAARLARQPLDVGESLTIARRTAGALAAAHARGVIHRDVKPHNILLVDRRVDRSKLVDFGLARSAAVTRAMTRTGAVLGTPGYMAPEQARGARELDARVDVYALGCVLFECLTGKFAFTGANPWAILTKILFEDAPRLRELRPELPAELEALVARLMARDPDARPRDGAAVVEALGALQVDDQLAAPAVAPRRTVLTGSEQRLVSVVLVGGGEPPDQPAPSVDAPTVALAPAAGVAEAARVAADHGGRLEHLASGALAVVLTGQGAATDQAARAARCALSLRGLLGDRCIVLATGRGVVAGWPVGEVIDRASRLLEPDGSAGIRIDNVTAGLLDGRFELADGPAGMELRGEQEASTATRRLLGRAIPCLGRERELSTLEGILRECAEDRVARAVLVTGEAGIGKSRLRHELLRRLEAMPLTVLAARGDPMRAGSPFGMAAQVIRSAAGLLDGEPIEEARARLLRRIGRHLAEADRQRVAELLGDLVGVTFPDDASPALRAARQDAAVMREQVRRAWEDWLAAECGGGPVLLILEDLHWGDAPTVNMVDAALRNLSESPLMVLALARPDVDELFPRLWAEREPQVVPLGKLSRGAAERLVREALGAVADDTVARVVEQAAGNAFYLEELIRAVAAGRTELPDTVLAMVQARLEALAPDARRVLRAASIFGGAFWRGGVRALVGEELDLPLLLGVLEQRELIIRRAHSRFPGDEEYAIRHDVVRQAAYGALTEADRTLGHRLTGAWLESRGESDHQVLAEHFERGGQPERALPHLVVAARRALDGFDLARALALVDRGVAAGAAGRDLADLRLVEAQVCSWRGDRTGEARAAGEARALAVPGSAAWFTAIRRLGHAYSEDSEATAALEAGALAQTPIDAAGAAEMIATGCFLAIHRVFMGHRDRAGEMRAVLEEVLARWQVTEPAALGWLHGLRAWLASGLEARRDEYAASAGAFRRAGSPTAQQAATHAAWLSTELGDLEVAEEEIRRLLAEAGRVGAAMLLASALENLGQTLSRAGRLAEAEAMIRQAIPAHASAGTDSTVARCHAYLAGILLAAGSPDDARAEIDEAMRTGVLMPPARCYAHGVRARVLLAQGQPGEALAESTRAMEQLATLGELEEGEAMVRLAHAEALRATGDHAAANAAIRDARTYLLAQAEQIRDAELRTRFLTRIPENAAILARATDWLGAGSPGS